MAGFMVGTSGGWLGVRTLDMGAGPFPGFGPAPPNVGPVSLAGVSGLASRSDHTHGLGPADWTGVRYYAADNDLGLDTNAGFSDVSMPAAGAVAVKTLERLRAIIPPVGAGRFIVVAIKTRAGGATYLRADGVTPDNWDDSFMSDYGYMLTRGTLDFTNTTSEKIVCGFITALAGPNGDGSFTVAAAPAPTVNTFTIMAGALTAEPALIGLRVRFKGNVTAGLVDIARNISANTGTAITLGFDAPVAPAVGDEFFIERPGVRVNRLIVTQVQGQELSSAGTVVGLNNIAGIAAVAAAGIVLTVRGQRSIFVTGCELLTAAAITGGSINENKSPIVDDRYLDETLATRRIGMGLRSEQGVAFDKNYSILTNAIANVSAILTLFSNTVQYTFGGKGSYFRGNVFVDNVGMGARASTVSNLILGNGGTATHRRMRITATAGTGLDIRRSNGLAVGIDFSAIGGDCIVSSSQGMMFAFADIVGTVGNVGVGMAFDDCQNCGFMLTAFGAGPNTVAGAGGEIRLDSALTTHAAFAITSVLDRFNNTYQGSAGSVVGQCVRIVNASGVTLAVGNIVRTTGVGDEVTRSLADTEANAGGDLFVMVTPPTNLSLGYAAPLGGGPNWVTFDAAPTPNVLSYLDEATAGVATQTVPPAAATNQKRRLGRPLRISGTLGLMTTSPEMLPIPSDGVAP